MDLIARVARHFEDSAQTKLNAVEAMAAPVAGAIEALTACLINGGRILACGNGGSAAAGFHCVEKIGFFFHTVEKPAKPGRSAAGGRAG